MLKKEPQPYQKTMKANLLIVILDLRIPAKAMHSVMIFIHAFLALDAHNQLLVIGSSSREARVIYPQNAQVPAPGGTVYIKFHNLDHQIRNSMLDVSNSTGFSKISAGLAIALTCLMS